MKALLLAAGLGTRLRPLTNDRPKALVEVSGMTLLERNIRFLTQQGISEVIINVHHFGEQIIEFVQCHTFDIAVRISDEREQLLDTGGALRKAAPFFKGEEDFLVYNTDVLSDIRIAELLRFHREEKNLATLAVRHRKTQRYILLDKQSQLIGRYQSGEAIPAEASLAAFSGIHILSTRIFDMLPEEEVFPIMPVYIGLSGKERIRGFFHDDSFWMDMGRPESIKAFENGNTRLGV